MIDAIFDRHSRSAAVSGVYQYDTGQRLRLRGLPSPDEMLERDTLLSGEEVTVQAQFRLRRRQPDRAAAGGMGRRAAGVAGGHPGRVPDAQRDGARVCRGLLRRGRKRRAHEDDV